MNKPTTKAPRNKGGRPKSNTPPPADLLFAAMVALTNTPAAAYQALHPKASLKNAQLKGALQFARPQVRETVASYRALAVKRAESAAELTLAQTDSAMLRACLDIVESADATAADRAKATAAYSVLRKALSDKGKDSPEDNTPQDLRAWLDSLKSPRAESPVSGLRSPPA